MPRPCVLLLEPDNFLGDIYAKALERAGHTVVWAKNAQQAIASADAQRPDVVVLELQLPGHGGVEFLYEFRSYPEWQGVPVVLHTFVALQNASALPPELGIMRHLYKPVTTLQALIRAVSETLPVRG